MTDLDKLTQKILTSQSPGMRRANLVDSYHFKDGDQTVSFVVYDKDPYMTELGSFYERHWTVVITQQDQPQVKTGGIVHTRFEESASG